MKHYPVENVYLYTSLHFPIVPNQKSIALCDHCLVYSISLVSNNYLCSNHCSVENNFNFTSEWLLYYCSSIWLLSVMKHYPVENVYLYTSHHFPIVPNQKSIALCDYCLVYSTSLVSNNYRGSNNCSVENNFHFRSNVLFPIAIQLSLLSVWNIIQLRMSIFTVNVIFPFAPLQKCCANRDNCLVNSTFLVSNNYLNSNKCSLDNNFHFSGECLVYICSSV